MSSTAGASWSRKASDSTWTRHANPWSVYTRMAMVPLAAVAIWSRAWIGWWCLVPIGLLVIWAVVNPIAFNRVDVPRAWASKGIYGERIQMDKSIRVPAHHKKALTWIMASSPIAILVMAWGLYALQFWPTAFGTTMIIVGQSWRLDRLVWMYEEMHPENATHAG